MNTLSKIEKKNIQDIIGLTSLQEGMLFHYLKDSDSNQYFEQLSLEIEGSLDCHTFKMAWNYVVQSNEMLRTVFRWKKLKKPVQIILKQHEVEIIESDLSKKDADIRVKFLNEIKTNDRKKKFNLEEVPFRIYICKLDNEKYEMIISNHHILYDGWSTGIILKEFFNVYNTLREGKDYKIPVKNKLKEYIKLLHKQDTSKKREFWNKYMEDFDSNTIISRKLERDKNLSGIDNLSFNMSESFVKKVNRFVKEKRITLASLLYSTWGILLQRYTSKGDVVFGTTVSGRNMELPGIENMVGLFINTLPLRVKSKGGTKIIDLLNHVNKSILEIVEYENTSLIEIKEFCEMNSSQNLFNSLFVIENYPLDDILNDNNCDFTIKSYSITEETNYDITVGIEVIDGLKITFTYNRDLFSHSDVVGFNEHFENILKSIVTNPHKNIDEIEMLCEEEKTKILFDFNNTKADYPKDNTIPQLFEEQVEKMPNNVAVLYEDEKLTYKQLNEKVNSLARVLRDKGVKPDTIVGIMVERSLEMIIGILGILKAGGAYLPIDPNHPEARIKYMLEDSGANILLTKSEENVIAQNFEGQVVNLLDNSLYGENNSNLECINTSNNLAYIIYTSGSTGKPKGVMIEHKSVINTLSYMERKYPLKADDAYLLKTSYTFDVSVTELFGWFIGEGKLVILKSFGEKDPNEICKTIRENNVTHMNFAPSTLNLFIRAIDKNEITKAEKLKFIFIAGEALSKELVKKSREILGHIQLENIYGPTEATIYTTGYSLKDFNDKVNITVPIGRPLDNVSLYVVDNNNQLAPIGILGELCISGDGLARGYLNKPQLTNEKFLENPFIKGQKMYRTGDLARWLPDGNIEFLGRIDNQVKIRGFRIELGEIESQLQKLPYIKETVVTVVGEEKNDKAICAYFVKDKDKPFEYKEDSEEVELDIAHIREELSIALPDYMIPSYLIEINEVPLTSHGKVDRKKLPKPDGNINTGVEYVAPRNDAEEKLVTIFKEVLDIESKVGIKENFFELGGHSLKATSLVSRIHKEFEVEIPLKEVFKSPTIEKISKLIEVSEKSIYDGIKPVEKREYYPMSAAQKRMYIINQMDKETTTYNMPSVLKLIGEVDSTRIEDAFKELINRHEALRTSFTRFEDQLVQIVKEASKVEFKIEYEDISEPKLNANLELTEYEKLIKDKAKEFIRPFDLEKESLLRVKVLKIKRSKYLLMVDIHHIISDGVSMALLIEEFTKLYEGGELEPLKVQYKDYAVWQNELLESTKIKEQERYWLKRFEGEIPILNMPTDHQRPAVQSHKGASSNLTINKKLTSKLNEIAKETESTLYMVLLSTINVLLGKYTGQEDIIVGSPIAGRPHNDLSNIVGMFVNTIAMRNYPKTNISFREFLAEVKENFLRAYDNQDVQFEDLVEKLPIERDISRNPLFDIMFVLQNTGASEKNLALEGLEISNYGLENEIAKFDITFTAIEVDGEIVLSINYATSLYKKHTIERLANHFTNMLAEISKDIDVKLQDIDILSGKEKYELLVEFNDTKVDYPKSKTIPQLFEEQVEKTPDNIAVVYEGENLTYKELNEKANSLARVLRDKGVKPDTIVGIMVDRSFEMVIGMLGILKAGGAYLPIDLEYPEDRMKHMLEDCKVSILLTHSKDMAKVDFDKEIICLDEDTSYSKEVSNLDYANKANDLVYIMYTSGSTGKPKGVMIENKSVIRLVKNTNYIEINENDRILQTGAIVFDASTLEVWGSLLNGAMLCLADKDTIVNADKLSKEINDKEISIIWITSSLFNQLAEKNPSMFKSCKYLLVGGDVVSSKHVNSVRSECKGLKVINGYGPTENTTFSTCYEIQKEYNQSIPIGKPISNSTAYIVEPKTNRLQPIGVVGELCVGGDGLARGYLNNSELTDEKFVDNPFKPSEKLYKTGDLAKWLPDGNIEFVGRVDNQVKIRGFRIELGEIESQLLKHKDIKEAVVMAREDNDKGKYLCGYIVVDKELTVLELRAYLGKGLPKYMIPSYFIQLDKMPLTTNGKVNRKALPKPDGNVNTGVEYVAPRNEAEEKLVQIFKEVLDIESQIGVKDNFFDLGGHSLKATMLASRIGKEFEADIPLIKVFEAPTIEEISKLIEVSDKCIYGEIKPVEKREYYPMSAAQKRMYIINQMDKETTTYNMPFVLELTGELDRTRLEYTFKELITRHESLRTSFTTVEDELVQIVKEVSEVDFKIEYKGVEEEEIQYVAKDFVRPFDLSKAPLLRVGLVKVKEDKHILMTDMHHIISDGTSMALVIEEFTKLYGGEELEPLKVQYKDYAVWQNELFQSGKIEKQERYWLEKFEGEIPVLNMPTDYQRPAVQSSEGDRISFSVGKDLKDKLQRIAKENDATLYMTLLAAYNTLLYRYTSQGDIIVGSPIAGRRQEDLSNIIGMFVNTLAMRNYPSGEKTFKEFLKEVKENSLNAYENQDIQFEELVEKLNIKRDTSRNPLFDTMFILQNMDMQDIELEGLKISSYDFDNLTSKFDTILESIETEEGISFSLEYCTKLFKKETIERLSRHFINILEHVAENEDVALSEIKMISGEEEKQILVDYNGIDVDYSKYETIHQLFEEQVEKTPDNIAVVYEDKELTYKELNEKVNSLARVLRNKGVESDSIVGIMVERSLEMVIGILGILKAGGAYLPIAPDFPQERIKYMLENSESNILLTQSQFLETISFEGQVIDLKDESVYEEDKTNLENVSGLNNLAYVIYTSGSTGKPKGVLIEHKSALNTLLTLEDKCPLKVDDVYLLKTTYTFDVSISELFGWFIGNGKLVMLEKGKEKDQKAIYEAVIKMGVTHINFAPSTLNAFINIIDEEDIRKMNTLKYVMVAGEAFPRELGQRCKEIFEGVKIENIYGPSETIYTTSFSLDKLTNKVIPIGKPYNNVKIYILDKHNKLVPTGIPGELCVSGKQMARGYQGLAKLSEEKFIDNPFNPEERMYKTGDLAKWLPDGNIEYLGRMDNQVKIRGFRIELGEIESRLLKHKEIKDAVVVAKVDDGGDKYLCGYVAGEKELTVSELREHLGKELPDYMIPSYFIHLEKMPLTKNGKIDKRALPELDGNINTGVEYVAPRNEVEAKVVEIFKGVLNIESQVGIKDNFFDLGGHSLKATILAARIRKVFEVEVPLINIFKAPTIEQISELIRTSEKSIYDEIKSIEKREYYPMSSAQKRMYIINQMDKEATTYNMPAILKLTGKLDKTKLENTFKELVNRHESLRTSFTTLEEELVQIVKEASEVEFKVECKEVNEEEIQDVIKAFIRPFDLSKGPLLRVGLLQVKEDNHILVTDMHHIISDGVSIALVIEEFTKLYGGEELEPLKVQYKDYAVWQNELFKSRKIEDQERYWLERFEGEIPVLNMSTDYQRPAVQSHKGASKNLVIDKELTNKLNRVVKETSSTLYMVLLSAINVLLGKYTGQEDIVIGSPIAGRPHNDLSNIVGMFVNTLAMRNYPSGEKTYKEFLVEVKENSLSAYDNQDIQFEELVEKLPIERDISRNPLFDIMFVLQNTGASEKNLELEGLEISAYDLENQIAKFDITFTATEIDGEISLTINYGTSLYKESTIERLSNHFAKVLEEISKDIDVKIQDIDILSVEEKHELLVEFNDTEAVYPKNKTIHQLFEEQVEKTPDNIAVVYEDQKLTYNELNEKANSLARVLRDKGVKSDTVVGIMVDRSLEMIVGILGVLKAGGAYLPIEPAYPEDRIKYMLDDSNTQILLIGDSEKNREEDIRFSREIINLNRESIYEESGTNLKSIGSPKDLAYVIYTSGTTGKPKGVMVQNDNLINLIWGINRNIYKDYNKELNIALIAPYVFDASVKQIFPSLILGHSLYIISEEARMSGKAIVKYYKKNKIDVSDGTPAHLTMITEALRDEDITLEVKQLNIGGDILTSDACKELFKVAGKEDIKIVNVYGPTECTDVTTSYCIKHRELSSITNVPVGKPINNARVYILDNNLGIVPAGVPGELCISGDGLGRGYLNKPELTRRKFTDNPYKQGEKMYKTGDLARWRLDGNIECLGRIDNQVKIRGFRIELEEIESRLLKHEDIKDAVVVTKVDSGVKFLCGYIAGEKEITVSELREHLGKELPDYMIPSYFIHLEKMPLTKNGKVDKRALPEIDENINTGVEYIAPRNEVEAKVVEIFKEVLNNESQVGIKDNFFDLGGHSLKATILAARIRKVFEVEIPLIKIFKAPTIEQISELIRTSEKSIYDEIKSVEKREYYPMSSAQKRMYIINQMDKETTTYNIPAILMLTGKLDKTKLENTFKELVNRHESLRTSFTTVEDNPVQILRQTSEIEFKIEYEDVSKIIDKKQKRINDKVKEFIKPFDLGKDSLLRVKLLKIMEDEHLLMVDMHHIISDGVSRGLVIEEFTKLYGGEELEPLKVQYKDYAVWQNELFKSRKIEDQERYWLERFEGEIPVLNMSTDYQRPAVQSHKGASKNFVIDEELTNKLNRVVKETGSTLYMVLLSAINVLLNKYTGQEDIVIGSPIAGRPHNDLSNIVGMFVNTLAMRNYPKSSKGFRDFLNEVKENSLKAYDNQDIQFEELVEKLPIERDISRNPLFDIMFILQNTGASEKNLELEGLEISACDLENQFTKFDITFTAIEKNGKISLTINYGTSLYKESTIERLANHFRNILEEISENVDVRIQDIDMLSEKERYHLLTEFNDTEAVYPRNKTIHQLFEEQVEKTPDNIAVVYEEEKLTYKELNEKANSLARVLRDKGVKSDTVVGIMVDRSLEMIVGILGVLKAGGAYLPIEPTYPEDRIKYMLEDSNTDILLIGGSEEDREENIRFSREIINLNRESIYEESGTNLKSIGSPKDLAYVIYTSGTTGKPKGVMVQNDNLINLIWGINRNIYKDYNKELNIALIAPYVFDASVKQIFPSLILGHSLYIISEEARMSGKAIVKYYKKNKIDVSDGTPAHLTLITEALRDEDITLEVKQLNIGGDILTSDACKELFKVAGKEDIKIVNVYGPTECTDVTTSYCIKHRELSSITNVPVGRPINNAKVYILDNNLGIVPAGVPGELCISGDGLGRGYLNKPELTDEKFVSNPFNPGGKMYKTGDLARWLPDGNIECLGRIDNQVKIRGFRIELGEIENKLLNHEKIKEAVVVAREDDNDDKYLCGYIVGDKELIVSELVEYLGKELPNYMIPSYFVEIDEIPLAPNGKINKKALPKPDRNISMGVEYVAPRNEIEEKVATIFNEVLDIESKVGIKDNFFNIGGHSLKAAMLSSRIHKEFKVEIPLIEIFKIPTIEKISKLIEISEKSVYDGIKSIEKREYYPMSAAQKRMYIINQMDKETTTYNMPSILKLTGKLDKVSFENTFKELINRHQSLRTLFTTVKNELVQIVKEVSEVEFKVEYKDVNEEEIQDVIKAFIRPFDLSKGPLIRIGILKVRENEHILMIDMHHIISDGVSMALVVEEFTKLYGGEELEPLKVQYKDYAVWQNELLKSGKIDEQERYWLERFGGEIPVLNMPTDYQRPAVQSHKGASKNFVIDKELTSKLNKIVKETGSTLYMVMLSAINVLLGKYTGQEDIVIGSPIAGRYHNDLSNIVGMFVNTLAMRNYPKSSKGFRDFLNEVKENSLKAYDNQDIQFEELVEKLPIERDISRNPLFDIMFALQNTGTSEKNLDLKGIEISNYDLENEISKFDITFTAIEKDGKISLNINYGTSLYKEETIERLANHFTNILEEISENIDVKIQDIDMLTEKERYHLLAELNDTKADYPKDKTIHQLFEEQVEKTPSNIAVVYEDEKLTYKELNEKANSLARVLRSKGVKPGDIIGIMEETSLELIVGILGILKSGGAYLPINPMYPEERIKYMLEDSNANVLLTKLQLQDNINFEGQIINLEDQKVYVESKTNLKNINKSNNLVYVIYTSGSTGKPKGVMVEHISLNNFLNTMLEKYERELGSDDSCLSLTNISFDVSVGEIFLPLTSGAKLILFNNKIALDIHRLVNTIIKDQITFTYIPPNILQDVSRLLSQTKQDIKLNKMLVGVEPIKDYVLEEFKNIKKDIQIVNGYGPTEATICSTMYIYKSKECDGQNVPIGKPISNSCVYILDRYNKLLPIGAPGELCISGDGLARGYLNKPELTDEKFVSNPFNPGEKMYKTGDLARWLPDGNIEFLGRIDNQVKIRGFRIELGEIENQLLNNEKIKEAVVVAREDNNGDKYLCGYIVGDKELTVSQLRESLVKELPNYMIPSYFINLENMPLTPNGKIDKRALPEPEGKINTGVEYVAPENEVEEKLVKIFKEVLDIESEIGTKDNFFDLGGHSLKANTLTLVIYKELGVKVPLMEVFKYPTIEKLSKIISKLDSSIYNEITPLEEKGFYPMSSVQERLFTVYQLDKKDVTYNIPIFVKFDSEFNKTSFERAIKELVMRHDSLRTNFEVRDEQFIQKIKAFEDISIEYHSAENEKDIEKICKEFVRPFDLEKELPFRCGLIECTNDVYVLMIDIHHIVSDGRSNEILTKEFWSLYNGNELEKLRIKYVDFACWENRMLENNEWEASKNYWKKVFKDEPKEIKLPYDFKLDKNDSAYQNAEELSWTLEAELYDSLVSISTQNKGTLYMAMLAAINMVMRRFANSEDIIIASPNIGRYYPDLEKIVGVFINMIPMRNYPKGELRISEFLSQVIENTQKAMENAKYPYQRILDEVYGNRRNRENSLFKVSFNYMNFFEDDIETIDLRNKEDFYKNETLKNEIDITAFKLIDGINLRVRYNKSLFTKEKMEIFLKNIIISLRAIASNLDTKLEDVEFTNLNTESNRNVIEDFNSNLLEGYYEKYGKGTIQSRLKETFEKYSDDTAIVFNGQDYPYKTLDRKSDVIADLLRSRGVETGEFIGVHLTDRVEILIMFIGILKARAVFVPLNPDFPNLRLRNMIKETDLNRIITSKELADNLLKETISGIECEVHIIDDDTYKVQDTKFEWGTYSERDEIYVCFTSGTTGIPKGMVGVNESLKSFIEWEVNHFKVDNNTTVSQVAAYSNDAYYKDILVPLFVGGAISIPPQKVSRMSAESIVSWVDSSNISVLQCTPSLFALINNDSLRSSDYKNLKYVLLAGEPLDPESLKTWYGVFGNRIQIANLYGASETTVLKTCYMVQPDDTSRVSIPIGKPIDGAKVLLLNDKGNVCNVGELGEIYVRTPFMTKGYYNDKGLTNKKFVQNPFIDTKDIIYKSGDKAVQLPDGNYIFKGRADDQVKIRGNRVELSEISSLLLQHKDIDNCVVIVREENNDKHICAYMIASKEVEISEIRSYLKERLADYMIPSYFVMVDEFKLNTNGKIDKKALPKPQRLSLGEKDYIGPRNKAQKLVEKGWRKVLDINESISIKENFFEIGGHSIIMLKLAGYLKRAFELEELNLIDLYENPTIERMAEFITSSERENKIFYELTKELKPEVTIYGVPYVGGDASCYGALARELDKQNMKVRIMSTSIFDIGNEIDGEKITIEKFAKIRAKEIADQGEENIYLLGHCGGSMIAIAIADELRKLKIKVKGIIVSGFVPTREPNRIIVKATKRMKFRQFVTALKSIGFTESLTVEVVKRYQKSIIELTEFRHRRRRKIKYRIFKNTTKIYNIIANRDPVTFNHKWGHRKWRRFAYKVEYIVIEGRSHYFISRNVDKVTSEINKIIEMNRTSKINKKNLAQHDVNEEDKAMVQAAISKSD